MLTTVNSQAASSTTLAEFVLTCDGLSGMRMSSISNLSSVGAKVGAVMSESGRIEGRICSLVPPVGAEDSTMKHSWARVVLGQRIITYLAGRVPAENAVVGVSNGDMLQLTWLQRARWSRCWTRGLAGPIGPPRACHWLVACMSDLNCSSKGQACSRVWMKRNARFESTYATFTVWELFRFIFLWMQCPRSGDLRHYPSVSDPRATRRARRASGRMRGYVTNSGAHHLTRQG